MSSTALPAMATGDKACQGMYPALAGNRAVTLASHNNLVQGIRHWAASCRPRRATVSHFGMPPYGQVLNDGEMAAVATFIRQSWGNSASPVSPLDVLRVK
jgi:mono/diheme cytochrome c family protein